MPGHPDVGNRSAIQSMVMVVFCLKSIARRIFSLGLLPLGGVIPFLPRPNRFNCFWTLGGTQFRAPDHLFANHLFANLDPSFFCQFCSRRLPVAAPGNVKLLRKQ